jgi:hypothetical protein
MTSTAAAQAVNSVEIVKALGALVFLYLFAMLAFAVANAGQKLVIHLLRLGVRGSGIMAQALVILAAWPFELALTQIEKWVAVAVERRTQWTIWRAEFRHKMSWAEFREHMTGRAKPQRDDYAEALSLFALAEPFTRPDLDTRFRRLMQGVHPDKGGSEFLAQQVTTARDLILKRKGWKR